MNRKQEKNKALETEPMGSVEAGGCRACVIEKSLIPDVRVSGEDSILERLGGHPAHRQQPLSSFPVIVCLVDVSRHTKICKVERRAAGEGPMPTSKGECTLRRLDLSVHNCIRQTQQGIID